jgi:ABC-type nitrate/sulfonate/bicarbonate transport system substrate-binding protein
MAKHLKEANKALEEYQKVEQAFKKASASYLADPANAEEIARIRAEGKPTPAATPKAAPTETTPAETTAAPAESIVETPATDPVGFARVQAIDSFDSVIPQTTATQKRLLIPA